MHRRASKRLPEFNLLQRLGLHQLQKSFCAARWVQWFVERHRMYQQYFARSGHLQKVMRSKMWRYSEWSFLWQKLKPSFLFNNHYDECIIFYFSIGPVGQHLVAGNTFDQPNDVSQSPSPPMSFSSQQGKLLVSNCVETQENFAHIKYKLQRFLWLHYDYILKGWNVAVPLYVMRYQLLQNRSQQKSPWQDIVRTYVLEN